MNQEKSSDSTVFLLIALALVVFLGLPALYAAKAGSINAFLLDVAKWELRPFWILSEDVEKVLTHLAQTPPEAFTWKQVVAALEYAGSWLRWPLFAMLGGLFYLAWVGRGKSFTRRFSMETLLENNMRSFPCLAPVVGRGKYLLDPKSFDEGPWMMARSPLQFALEKGLLKDEKDEAFTPDQALRNGLGEADMPAYGQGRFDRVRAMNVFDEQLGPKFMGVAELPPFRQALAAAFMAYAAGERKEAVAILDEMSLSYTQEPEADTPATEGAEKEKSCPRCAVLEVSPKAGKEEAEKAKAFRERIGETLARHKNILDEPCLKRHSAYVLPWFMALLTRARKKGVLAGPQFLFARPIDRPLWYALNQCGGRAAWVEAFAPWAHYMAEEKAGKALEKPDMADAAYSLEAALDALGWLYCPDGDGKSDKEKAASFSPAKADSSSGERVESPFYEDDSLFLAGSPRPRPDWEGDMGVC